MSCSSFACQVCKLLRYAAAYNFDHPNSIDNAAVVKCLDDLKVSHAITTLDDTLGKSIQGMYCDKRLMACINLALHCHALPLPEEGRVLSPIHV